MISADDLEKLEVYCVNEKCGDPVADRHGNVHYTKRRMNLMRTDNFVQHKSVMHRHEGAVYVCPICKKEKRFSFDSRTNSIHEE